MICNMIVHVIAWLKYSLSPKTHGIHIPMIVFNTVLTFEEESYNNLGIVVSSLY